MKPLFIYLHGLNSFPASLKALETQAYIKKHSLDYRLAVDKYKGCRSVIQEGGHHGFEGFDRILPGIFAFFND